MQASLDAEGGRAQSFEARDLNAPSAEEVARAAAYRRESIVLRVQHRFRRRVRRETVPNRRSNSRHLSMVRLRPTSGGLGPSSRAAGLPRAV